MTVTEAPTTQPTADATPPVRSRWTPSRFGRRLASKKRWFLGAAVLMLVATGAAAAGMVYGLRSESAHWTPLYRQATADAAAYQKAAQGLDGDLIQLRGEVSSKVGDLNNPSFGLWNTCGQNGCQLTPGYEFVGGVPDTFTYYVSFTATVPVTVRIMSTGDFVCWETRSCTSNGVGWEKRTELNGGVFHDAEGCAGYIAVFFSDQAGTLTPNIRVTRNPASTPTGVCASGTGATRR